MKLMAAGGCEEGRGALVVCAHSSGERGSVSWYVTGMWDGDSVGGAGGDGFMQHSL